MSTFSPDLIARLVQKESEAYNTFYMQTVDMLYRFLLGRYVLSEHDREDVLSTFYMKFWKVVDRYDATYTFETYMWTVFRNVIKDYFKAQQRVHFVDETVVALEEDESDILAMMEKDFQFEDIARAMQQLDDHSYDIIFLKFIEMRTYEEIAHELSLSQDAVRQRISRALKRLQGLLGEI